MSTKLFTNKFKTFAINKLVSSNPVFYMFLGKHLPFDDDNVPPTPIDSINETFVGTYDTMFAAKGIRASDMSYMIPRNEWATGTAYKAYRADSGDLYGNGVYTSVASASGYDVFKCLSNNGVSDGKSTVKPDITATSASDDIYETSDGYQWKYMYSIPTATFDKFATRDYIPIVPNANVTGNAVAGAIEYISVDYGGSNYDAYTNGTIQAAAVGGNTRVFTIESTASNSNNFYVGSALKITAGTGSGQMREIVEYTSVGSVKNVVISSPFDTLPTTSSTYDISPHVVIVGSGTNFQGRALVNAAASNSIYKVEIVNRGAGYYYANATPQGNTGGVSNAAILTPVIGPYNGHGYDPITELGARYLCLTATFDTSDTSAAGKIVDANDFRAFGIIANPLLANVAIEYTDISPSTTFAVGQTVTQANTGATGVIVSDDLDTLILTNVTKSFTAGLRISSSTANANVVYMRNNGSANLVANVEYVNTTTRLGITDLSGSFTVDQVVTMTGNVATSNATVYFSNTTNVWLTNIRGPITVGSQVSAVGGSTTATIGSIAPSDFKYGTGDILYIENISPINKSSGQTETIKAIIEF